MDNVGYVSLSAEVSLRRNLDVVANNIANMNTVGYKADRMIFAEVVNKSAGTKNTSPTSFVQDKHTWTDFSAGPLRQTGSNLNVAITGEGFLGVETENGIQYTRDGHFLVSNEGILVNLDGNPVLNMDGGQIQLPAGANDVTISKNGTITNNGVVVARLGVFTSENPQAMKKVGSVGFTSDADLAPNMNAQLLSGMLEDANINSISEMTRMISISKAYDEANNLSETADGLRKDAVARLGRV
ncbi:flagellar basal-body rod protein FlgF [Mesorhizobium sp. SP-1A]|uniref:flagellar basal-body rod protein FlgF n=1 Tax=Mesorhizobium sp. SP-1A TaxID=3077840 RepID=UPI0028F6F35E|nr:flagellar basal-body rod protein FlgF [Mesorhizobium sp. SP-1A]